MNSSDKEKEEPKIFMKGTLEWNEYLEKHPDRKREEQMKDEEETQALLDSFKPFNDFKDKVRALGKEIMEIESIKTSLAIGLTSIVNTIAWHFWTW
jgi:hypothetical protein